jgi:hypothetical protein
MVTVLRSDVKTSDGVCDELKNTLLDKVVVEVATDNDENTVGHVNMTITSTSALSFEHALCVRVPAQHGGDGVRWRRAGTTQEDGNLWSSITVSDVVSVAPRKFGRNIPTTATLGVINVLSSDSSSSSGGGSDLVKVVPRNLPCQEHAGLITPFSLSGTTSARTSQVAGIDYSGEIKTCLKLAMSGNPRNRWEEVSDTATTGTLSPTPSLTVSIPNVEFMSPTRVVRNQQSMFLLRGHGIHLDMQFKLVQKGDTDCVTRDAVGGTSASQLKGLLTNIAPDGTTGELTLKPTQAASNASLCYHATVSSGGTGQFSNRKVVRNQLVIIHVGRVTPSTICVNHPGRLDLVGQYLDTTKNDSMQIVKAEADCSEIKYPDPSVLWPNENDLDSGARLIDYDKNFFVSMKVTRSSPK